MRAAADCVIPGCGKGLLNHRSIEQRKGRRRTVGCPLFACALALFGFYPGQTSGATQESAGSAVLQGSVRDVGGKPVSGATVILTGAGESRYPSLRTDANGGYRFSGLSEGAYHLSAKMAGYADATIGPCSLAAGESKNVDLSLGPSPSSGQKGVP